MIYLKNKILEYDYYYCIEDIIKNESIKKMKEFPHHGNITRYDHCINVSYLNYKICKLLKLDYKSAARAGILHDFFLYNWKDSKEKGILNKHGFIHPKVALKNAEEIFHLNNIEKDMILNHMWPLTIRLPKYKETYIITLSDKICCLTELIKSLKVSLLIKSMFN